MDETINECFICLLPYEITGKKKKHIFCPNGHHACNDDVLKMLTSTNKCPMCREPMRKNIRINKRDILSKCYEILSDDVPEANELPLFCSLLDDFRTFDMLKFAIRYNYNVYTNFPKYYNNSEIIILTINSYITHNISPNRDYNDYNTTLTNAKKFINKNIDYDIFDYDAIKKNSMVHDILYFETLTPNRQLLTSAFFGDFKYIISAIDAGAQVDLERRDGKSALIIACENGHLEILKYLHKKGAKIDITDSQKKSAFTYGCENGHLEVVKYLHQNGAKDQQDCVTGAMLASEKGDLEIVHYLHENNLIVDVLQNSDETLKISRNGIVKGDKIYNIYSCFGMGCVNGNIEIVDLLMKAYDFDLPKVVTGALTNACANGHAEIADMLLSKYEISDIYKALLYATKNGHWETVKLLIEKNTALVNEKKKYDRTLLMVACMSGCIRSVKILLENHANINDKDVNGDTALIYATRNAGQDTSYLEIVQLLIKNNANTNIRGYGGYNALMQAAFRRNALMTTLLISEKNTKLNLKDNDGNTALMVCCSKKLSNYPMDEINLLSCIKSLLTHGADPNIKNNMGETALMHACSRKHTILVEYLVNFHQININIQDNMGQTALMIASIKNHKDILQLLFQKKADVHLKNHRGESALIQASKKGNRTAVLKLITNKSNINIRTNTGESALIWASIEGHLDIVAILIEHEAISYYLDVFHRSAIWYATKNGHVEIVKLLLEHSPLSLNAPGYDGMSLLMIASNFGHVDIIELLLKKGANVNAQNNKGDTALIIASRAPSLPVIQLLINNDANIHIKGFRDRDALANVQLYNSNRSDMITLLAENGALFELIHTSILEEQINNQIERGGG